jgi:DMSO/TMAO reductase YedYZ molybdopterin-dependent catalytic subunit
LRWLPKATPLELTVSVEGALVQTFTAADLDRFEHLDQVSDFHCVTGWTYRGVRWGGVRLRDVAHGAPLRLVSPGQYGYKNVKHLIGIDFQDALIVNFRDRRPVSTELASTLGPKEHRRGRVALEERHASLPNWAVRLAYRMMIIPTALAGDRGLRKSPE